MQDYIYYNKQGLDFPLSEKIFVTTDIEDVKEKSYLISNSKEINSELSALEIDFYIKNSNEEVSKKIKNVLELYELNATKYDLSQDFPQSMKLSNTLLVIGSSKEEYEELVSKLNKDEFEIYKIDAEILKTINGTIGEFEVLVSSNEKEIPLNVSQIIYFNENLEKKKAGILDPNILGLDEVLNLVRANVESFSFSKYTTYNQSICQYDSRKDEICSKCEEVCPTNAITKIDATKTLVFSNVDCTSCGECVSVCPSGSLNSAELSRDSLYELSLSFKNRHPLIISSKVNLEDISAPLKENVFPFVTTGDIFDESTFLTFLQISGSQIVYFSNEISKGTLESIRILNDIYQAKYNKDAIFFAHDEESLNSALAQVEFIENSYFNFNQTELKKREVFSQRLQKIVGEDDLGVVKTGEHIHYGRVLVNEANCTLCLACVGACNVDALFANESDFTLRVIPSVCTACGYCEVVCPEADCLTIVRDEIELSPKWFKEATLAKDTLFACVECGKEFATTKAIEKIAGLMAPLFAKVSEAKKRTLYCCEDCKPKIMIQQGLLDA